MLMFQCDERVKDFYSEREFAQLNSNLLSYLSIGSENYRNKFTFCIRRFVVNNQAQDFESTTYSTLPFQVTVSVSFLDVRMNKIFFSIFLLLFSRMT